VSATLPAAGPGGRAQDSFPRGGRLQITKRLLLLLGLCAATARAAGPDPRAGDDPWLSRLIGQWVLEGRIAGKDTTHDVDAEWVLNHLYVRLHEVSREKDSRGRPAYEAIVYVTWYPAAGEYAAMWLDSTGSGGFAAEGTGHAKPEGKSLPFVFKDAKDRVTFRNTFAYDATSDTWAWLMDNVDEGVARPFGRVKLSRRGRAAVPPSSDPGK
jgi:hypothetical protein